MPDNLPFIVQDRILVIVRFNKDGIQLLYRSYKKSSYSLDAWDFVHIVRIHGLLLASGFVPPDM